jgi:hypothetical protein
MSTTMTLITSRGRALRMILQWLAIGIFIARLVLLNCTDHFCTTIYPPPDDWIFVENLEKLLLAASAELTGACVWFRAKWPLSLYVSCLVVLLIRCWGYGASSYLLLFNAPLLLMAIPRTQRWGAVVAALCIFATVDTEWCGMLACR